MKTHIWLITLCIGLSSNLIANGQNLTPSEVPSVIRNKFQIEYPNASDIEWELDGENYHVEFESNWFTDYDVWYNPKAEIVRYKADISARDLPSSVKKSVKSNYSGYAIDEAKLIIQKADSAYIIDLETLTDDRKVVFDKTGNIISDIQD